MDQFTKSCYEAILTDLHHPRLQDRLFDEERTQVLHLLNFEPVKDSLENKEGYSKTDFYNDVERVILGAKEFAADFEIGLRMIEVFEEILEEFKTLYNNVPDLDPARRNDDVQDIDEETRNDNVQDTEDEATDSSSSSFLEVISVDDDSSSNGSDDGSDVEEERRNEDISDTDQSGGNNDEAIMDPSSDPIDEVVLIDNPSWNLFGD